MPKTAKKWENDLPQVILWSHNRFQNRHRSKFKKFLKDRSSDILKMTAHLWFSVNKIWLILQGRFDPSWTYPFCQFNNFLLKIWAVKSHNFVINWQKMSCYNPILDLVSFKAYAKFIQYPSDPFKTIGPLVLYRSPSAEDMSKSAIIEEKKFKHSPWAGADNPLGPNFWCQQEGLITIVICCKFKKNLFNLWLYTHLFMN